MTQKPAAPPMQERIDRDVVADLHRIRITRNLRTISDTIRYLLSRKDPDDGDIADR